jgi:hypothetical protein
MAGSVSVSGTIARELIELGKRIQIYDDAFDRDYIEARSIHCVKTGNNQGVEIRCQMIGNGKKPQMVTISSKDEENSDAAPKLRRILMEGTGRDRKINPTTKFLNIDSLICSGERLHHEMDNLDSEPQASCVVEFSNQNLFL